jgi:hypothetical protein
MNTTVANTISRTITKNIRRFTFRIYPSSDWLLEAFLFFFVHPITQFFSRLEVRHEFAIEADRLSGFWVATNAGSAVMQGKATKATYLNTVARRQTLGHLLKHGLDG